MQADNFPLTIDLLPRFTLECFLLDDFAVGRLHPVINEVRGMGVITAGQHPDLQARHVAFLDRTAGLDRCHPLFMIFRLRLPAYDARLLSSSIKIVL